MREYEYDVALAYAAEDQELVLPVIQHLENLHVKIMHGAEPQVEQQGLDLVSYFSATSVLPARYLVLFSSRHYVDKWGRLQQRVALARVLKQYGESVLPVRIDDTEVPGLSRTVGYLDLRVHGPKTIARAIVQKLARHRTEFTSRTPITPRSVESLVREQPPGWEHLLYAAVVSQGIEDLERKYREHFLRYAPRNGTIEHGTGLGLFRDRNVRLKEIGAVASDILFSPETLKAAFEPPGDADEIMYLGRLHVLVFDEFLEWAREIHGTSYANADAKAVARLQARFADHPLRGLRRLAEDLRDTADTLTERLLAGTRIEMPVRPVSTTDAELEQEMNAALLKLSDQGRPDRVGHRPPGPQPAEQGFNPLPLLAEHKLDIAPLLAEHKLDTTPLFADYRFDVAPSFAGEDRHWVRPIVRRLEELGVRVFYDEDLTSELWGENLGDQLPEIYGKLTRYVILFVSQHYVGQHKKWPKVERQAAQSRAIDQPEAYLLPIRLDDTEIPGLPSTVAYIDRREHSVDEIARALVKKLAQHKQRSRG